MSSKISKVHSFDSLRIVTESLQFFVLIILFCKVANSCLFNFCDLPGNDFCEGRQCRMAQDCNDVECYCDGTSTHPSCFNTTPDCPCVNGYCDVAENNETICICEEGFGGFNCSEALCIFNPCDFAETCSGQDCKLLPNCSVECCDVNSTSCGISPPPGTTGMPSPSPCNGGFTYRSQAERTCGANVTCKYGRCVVENSTALCLCDDGARGPLCQDKCCMDCGLYGECKIHEQMGEYCHCNKNHTGYNCSVTTPEYNPCYANYTGRTSVEQFCEGVGLSCVYGRCVKTNSTSYCMCDKGADGYLCQHKCCLECGPYGECRWNNLLKQEYCNCFYNHTGDRCEKVRPVSGPAEEVTWYWWVVGACALVLVVLIIVIALVPFVMWKHRVILVMKLVYYFQKYEDDDERTWDAFVSFRSIKRDESFIVNTLRPKLEEELGFKLCLHFRDFIPGATISDNIIRAVKESRRTILLISPEYVQSEWTKMEYEVAQQEMLKRKQRIIPVLLEDISQCKSSMDPTLKNILSAVTYLEWPDETSDEKRREKFWKRLQLSLPKKRSSSETNETSQMESYRKLDDFTISYPIKNKLTNGFLNDTFDNDMDAGYDTIPADEYDTINESEMDSVAKDKTFSSSAMVTDETKYLNILNESTHC